ncbi:MAG TPA: 5'/3'-nucleotidase SurE [Candidatus Brocadiia bacterium]|nr:5'/3'-nucleotidase SurE [Candidatus Brocadiales bacterium]
MRILLTNDDGIYSPGIAALKRVIKDLGDVTVVAPDVEQSGVGHSVTLSHPLRVREVYVDKEFLGYGVNGSPADCVKLAVFEIMKGQPDLVISGINLGANVGIHTLYSGTVAASIEGAILGIPSVAISLETSGVPDISQAAQIAKGIIDCVLHHGLPKGTLLNINIPSVSKDKIKGIRITRQYANGFDERFDKRTDPGGRTYYWLAGGDGYEMDEHDTDIHAIKEGYISITPLRYDLTNHELIPKIEKWGWKRGQR